MANILTTDIAIIIRVTHDQFDSNPIELSLTSLNRTPIQILDIFTEPCYKRIAVQGEFGYYLPSFVFHDFQSRVIHFKTGIISASFSDIQNYCKTTTLSEATSLIQDLHVHHGLDKIFTMLNKMQDTQNIHHDMLYAINNTVEQSRNEVSDVKDAIYRVESQLSSSQPITNILNINLVPSNSDNKRTDKQNITNTNNDQSIFRPTNVKCSENWYDSDDFDDSINVVDTQGVDMINDILKSTSLDQVKISGGCLEQHVGPSNLNSNQTILGANNLETDMLLYVTPNFQAKQQQLKELRFRSMYNQKQATLSHGYDICDDSNIILPSVLFKHLSPTNNVLNVAGMEFFDSKIVKHNDFNIEVSTPTSGAYKRIPSNLDNINGYYYQSITVCDLMKSRGFDIHLSKLDRRISSKKTRPTLIYMQLPSLIVNQYYKPWLAQNGFELEEMNKPISKKAKTTCVILKDYDAEDLHHSKLELFRGRDYYHYKLMLLNLTTVEDVLSHLLTFIKELPNEVLELFYIPNMLKPFDAFLSDMNKISIPSDCISDPVCPDLIGVLNPFNYNKVDLLNQLRNIGRIVGRINAEWGCNRYTIQKILEEIQINELYKIFDIMEEQSICTLPRVWSAIGGRISGVRYKNGGIRSLAHRFIAEDFVFYPCLDCGRVFRYQGDEQLCSELDRIFSMLTKIIDVKNHGAEMYMYTYKCVIDRPGYFNQELENYNKPVCDSKQEWSSDFMIKRYGKDYYRINHNLRTLFNI